MKSEGKKKGGGNQVTVQKCTLDHKASKRKEIITPGSPTTPSQLNPTARRTLRYSATSPACPAVPWSSWMGVRTPKVRADAVKLPLPAQAHDSSCDRGTFHLPSPLQVVTVRDKAVCKTAASQS